MDNQTFFEKYSGKKDGVPDPVPALWDNIKIGYTETLHNAPSIENSQSTSRAANTKINLLKNPSFDKTTAGWQRVSKKTWRQNVGGRSTILETQIESTSGGSGRSAFMQCINLEPDSGQVFEAGIEIQNVPGYTSGGGAMRFTWYEKYGCKGKYQGDKNSDEIIAEATGWVPLILYNLERPNGATSVQMELIHTIDKAGDRRVWWDDAYFYSLR
jgi:hypothetical protein